LILDAAPSIDVTTSLRFLLTLSSRSTGIHPGRVSGTLSRQSAADFARQLDAQHFKTVTP
jgi:hypothetical protein